MPVPLVSIVVCTCNRATLLPLSLDTLAWQTLAQELYEVIIVDNNSTDETAALVTRYLAREKNFRLVTEIQQGLSHARNLGWRTAQADYVAYIDDDCKVPPSWGAVTAEVIQHFSPAIFGGPAHPLYLTPRPHWYLDRYAERVWHGENARNLNIDEHLGGMNIVFRKTLLQKLNGFNPHLGMTGNTIAYGEETDVVLRARQSEKNLRVYYDPRLEVHHAVRPEKMTLVWKMWQSFSNGFYSQKLFPVKYTVSHLGFLLEFGKEWLRLLRLLVWNLWRRDRQKYPCWQNFFYEEVSLPLARLGGLSEHLFGSK
jgi:glycosyltransferase involved in cell wall biosynthesis